ncbi:MAG: HEAT repeat domain-containing protein [Promethearchaeota archaeon]
MMLELVFVLIFIGFSIFGFIIIYRQVNLIKKGEFTLKDRLFCFIYAIFFAMGASVVIGMAIIFTIETPDFWETSETPPPTFNPLFFLIPFFACLGYISIYPLMDFLFMALNKRTERGFTPIHEFIEDKIINLKENHVVRIIISVLLYLGAIIAPIMILTLIGVPLIISYISWVLIYPLIILTYFGSKGYIAGISDVFYHIPDMRRAIFLHFEDRKRAFNEFAMNPAPYIIFGLMIFVYIWAWISMIQTIVFFFTGTLAFSTMSSYFVFITLFLGISGYFTRYFGRQVQSKGYHLLFAAYLMTAIGINVLVNFLLVNPDKLEFVFSLTSLTSEITPNYKSFAWAAIIEEVVLLIITTYYFLALNDEYIQNIRYSKITESSQNFDPLPLFNLMKNKNIRIREHAREHLVLMFERIPLKSELDINNPKFKFPLLDGISDSNSLLRRTCIEILDDLKEKNPETILSWIIESMHSPNLDKSIPLIHLLLKMENKYINKIPIEDILNLIYDSEWRLKFLGLKLISKLGFENNALISYLNMDELLYHANFQVQLEALKLIGKSSQKINISLIIEKIHHPNKKIRAQAIRVLQIIEKEKLNPYIHSRILPLLNDPSGEVRAATFNFFASREKPLELGIPLGPFIEGLTDPNEEVRRASVKILEKIFMEDPKTFDLNVIINRIDPTNIEALNSILSLLGKIWDRDPEKVLLIFLTFIKFDDIQLKNTISRILISKYDTNPNLILDNLIKIPDDYKFLSKGIISTTLIQIAKKDPEKNIPILLRYLKSDNEDIVLNALLSLEGLLDDHTDMIELSPILSVFKRKVNTRIKRQSSKFLLDLVKKHPLKIKSSLSEIFKILDTQDPSVRISLSKALLEIIKDTPKIVSLSSIQTLLEDEEPLVREAATKIFGYMGALYPEEIQKMLLQKALKDGEWMVRVAAVSSLGKLARNVKDKTLIIENLVTLLDDPENWVRRTTMNVLANIPEVSASNIPFEKVVSNLNSEDPKVREGSVGLLKIYSFNNIDRIFDKIIMLLGDESDSVRFKMVSTMVEIIEKIGLSEILSKLLKNLSEETSIETQRSIALILRRTTKYEEEKIKKRVISVLKIRCEMSQDPVICKVFQELKTI